MNWDWQHESEARRSDAYGAGLRDGAAAFKAGRPASSCDPADWDERYAANYRNGWEHAWHGADRDARIRAGQTGTMTTQLHITHRSDYLRGRQDGSQAGDADADYRPRDGAAGTVNEQRAYRQGYSDGYLDAHPCDNGTCGHFAHCGS